MSHTFTMDSFQEADHKTQGKLLKKHGVYIDSYFTRDTLVNSYALFGFFVQELFDVRLHRSISYISFEKGFSVAQRGMPKQPSLKCMLP